MESSVVAVCVVSISDPILTAGVSTEGTIGEDEGAMNWAIWVIWAASTLPLFTLVLLSIDVEGVGIGEPMFLVSILRDKPISARK